MKRLLVAALVAALGILTLMLPAAAQNEVTVTLTPQNDSGQSGTATLTPMGEQTQVVLNISGGPADIEQPTHIHAGTCENLDPNPAYPLSNISNGQSTTTVDVSLESLLTGGFAINVHESAENIANYVACGDIPAAAQVAPATGQPHAQAASTSPMIGGLMLLATLLVGGGLVLRTRTIR